MFSSPKIPQIWCIFPCISWVLTEVLTQIQDSKPRSGSPGSPTSLSHSRSNENAKMGCMMVCGWSKRTSMSAGVGLALRIPAKKLVSAPKKHQLRIVLPCKPYQTLSNFAMLGFWVSINCTLFVMFPEQSSLITLASLVMNYTALNTVPIVSFWSFWDFYMAQQTSESLAVLGPHHHNKSTHIFANRSPSTKLLPTLGYKKKSK